MGGVFRFFLLFIIISARRSRIVTQLSEAALTEERRELLALVLRDTAENVSAVSPQHACRQGTGSVPRCAHYFFVVFSTS